MSKAIEEEEEEEKQCFHDSLNRLLASANTSCSSSTSSSEEDEDCDMGVSNNYDVWISESSSIQERRLRLFSQMDLSHLKCQDPCVDPHQASIGKCSDYETVGSKLYVDSNCYSSDILCINSMSSSSVSVNVDSGGECIVVNSNGNSGESLSVDQLHEGNRSAVSRDNESCYLLPVVESGEIEDDLESNRDVEIEESVCTIKNLDNGKEFVVNEVREDGMWNKLKEVSTGKQLTMDEFDMCFGTSPIVQELMRRQNV